MANTKKITKKSSSPKNRVIEIKVVNDNLVPNKNGSPKTGSTPANKVGSAKVYPPIYTYIYEREPEDMARIYEEHKTTQDSQKRGSKITGFKLLGDKLVAIPKTGRK